MKTAISLCFCIVLLACGTGDHLNYLKLHGIEQPTPTSFTHCFNYGCQTRVVMALPPKTQDKLIHLFSPLKTAEEERDAVARAIQIFEQDIGEIVGTKNDKRGTFRLYQDRSAQSKIFQQDCVDESTNTTIYLSLLDTMGALKFHKPVFVESRSPLFGGGRWWHQTAVMQDISSGAKYAVDSWFKDNGAPAFIVPLPLWKQNWLPPRLDKNQTRQN